ncbi:hypothetical protein [Agromyces bracchium]|uniref:Uncharacterized protein n=1 Tax=Agromyces bracchium TaxID=88376 RepID=A0A6I3M9Q7_9MICO|nr:hypothetical protein [Agromyces bracchium]MTH70199.1 hypothetical protein [Agromyces bracchium]
MPNTVDQAIRFARDHPTKDVGQVDSSWAGWCAALVFWAGGFGRSFGTALEAGSNSGTLHPDWRTAPRGAIHYWAGVFIDGVECGHTAIDIGGGNHTLLMASSRVDNFGTAIGTITFADYDQPSYRGWSMKWGSETLAGVDTLGRPRPDDERDDDMTFRIVNPTDPGDNALYALSDSGRWVKISNPADLLLLQKFRSGDIGDITKGQVSIIRQYLQKLSPSSPPFDAQAFAAAVAKRLVGRVNDSMDIEQAVNDAIEEQVPPLEADPLIVRPG